MDKSTKKNVQLEKSVALIGLQEYEGVYKKACDSIQTWTSNDLQSYWTRYNQEYKLDSLLCFNSNKDRFISCIHRFRNESSPSDELLFFLGEKIKNQWIFFRTASITLPRKMYQNDEKNALSYQQLHQIALKEVYGVYLTPSGEINEAWFTGLFEGPGWGDFNDQEQDLKYLGLDKSQKFTDRRKFFEAIHLQSVRNNWYGVKKDTAKVLL